MTSEQIFRGGKKASNLYYYDKNNNVGKYYFTLDGERRQQENSYGKDNLLQATYLEDNIHALYSYDGFNRVRQKVVGATSAGARDLYTNYTYAAGTGAQKTTALVETMQTTGQEKYHYRYDASGEPSDCGRVYRYKRKRFDNRSCVCVGYDGTVDVFTFAFTTTSLIKGVEFMLYGIIRILFFAIIFIVAVIFIQKSKIIKKRRVAVLTLVMSMLLCSASFLLPVENLFIHFKSPQDVFRYSCKGTIQDIVYGDDSCLAFSADAFTFIPKSKKGYKVPTVFSSKTIVSRFDKSGDYKIINVVNTKDFYIWGSKTVQESAVHVSDNNNSNIKTEVTKNGETDYYAVLIYGLINNYSDNYCLFINGETISLTPIPQ